MTISKFLFSEKTLYYFLLIFLFSCGGTAENPLNKPLAIGRINKIDVILDKKFNVSNLKDSIDNYYAGEYPVTPAPEPYFDLRFLDMEDLVKDPYKKELKTYLIIADLSDTFSDVTRMVMQDLGEEKLAKARVDSSFNMLVGRDKWAEGQLLVYLFAYGVEKLEKAVSASFEVVAQRIHKHDEKSLHDAIYGVAGENKALMKIIRDSFGIDMAIPEFFQQAILDDNFLWIRMDQKDVLENLVFRRVPYTSSSQFEKESIIGMRNEYGKKYITTLAEGAYMSTNVKDLPIVEYIHDRDGNYLKEVRGIWETVNDFKGGPYASYLWHNKQRNELIFIDAFIFAPGKEKRDYMQKLQYMVKKASFTK